MTEAKKDTAAESKDTLVSHLVELRNRLLKCTLAVVIVFAALIPFAKRLYSVVALPLLEKLPEGGTLIAIQVAAPFLTPFKLALVLAIFLSVPVLLYQLWAFVAPGLYKNERRLIFPLLFSSSLLFYAGVAFSYFVVFPLIFAFFSAVAPEGVQVVPDMTAYLDFVLKLFMAFGLAFEVPVATVLLVWTGFVTPEKLAKNRAYVFLGAFVVGMLLTPPDVISQTLLAVPVYILYELGIIMAKILVPRKEAGSTTEEPATKEPATEAGEKGS